MIKILPYNAELKAAWDSFVESSKNGIFMFKRDFMDYHADRFVDNSLLFYSDDELIALLPLSRHDNVLKSHGGLTFGGFISSANMKQIKMNECVESLIEYLRERDFTHLEYKKVPQIYNEIPSEEDIYALWRHNAILSKVEPSTAINLCAPVKMSKGRKAQISRAKREGVEVVESSDFEGFIALENEILAKYHNAKAVHSGAELALLAGRFPENIKLYIARQNGNDEILAGVVLFVYKNLVHTQYMASSEKGREIGALDLVVATLLDKYSDKIYFDFGISSENNGLNLNTGLIAQKESFGARVLIHSAFTLYQNGGGGIINP
ncbi:GNAT family N-acetyltransferase [Helicobacter sp. 23-1048]